MKFEYLLFNLIILTGPIVFSFDKTVVYYKNWVRALFATLLSLVPFIIWDIWVTGKHWHFNTQYTTDLRILGLPPGEWLFFITVPFACLFIWEILSTKNNANVFFKIPVKIVAPILLALIVVFFVTKKEYTFLVFTSLLIVILLDQILETNLLFQQKTIRLLLIVTGLILIFNGYLTARPVVLYDDTVNLGVRIFTIPLEDFFYGISHVLLTVIFYERLERFSWKKQFL